MRDFFPFFWGGNMPHGDLINTKVTFMGFNYFACKFSSCILSIITNSPSLKRFLSKGTIRCKKRQQYKHKGKRTKSQTLWNYTKTGSGTQCSRRVSISCPINHTCHEVIFPKCQLRKHIFSNSYLKSVCTTS